ncbi:MAG: AmmeMemoRadiSam system radical SAM enzyme [Methylococcales bacterium]|jgi:pyruvate formate lyase activating enzyme|nr:AmmeMemoRadiSam system radical SAM enzyme [Methylococcales bacterium]MBT7409153.1 AmmeMemoRadiSam system radical SAM enzyme [Methylococcales bacterium]
MNIQSTIPTKFWHAIDDNRIQCDVCPRECKLREGQSGMCFVRARHNDQVVLTTYGRSSGFCIDPIEKKPLNQFYPGSAILSFGTAGCNLACKFCQNWSMSKSKEKDILASEASPEAITQMALRHQCKSIAYTYNDPVIFLEYAIDTAQAAHANNIYSVAVTAGYIQNDAQQAFFQHMDAANVDLKAFTEKFYWKVTGGHLQPVLETLKYLKHETNVWFEITTLLIPGENDSEEELNNMTQWIAENLGFDVPIHFTAFHPDWKMQNKPRTSILTLQKARQIAKLNGLNFVYTGNVQDTEGGSTYCSNCGHLLIERMGYTLGRWQLTNINQCPNCHTTCAGHFNHQAENWGARRLPIK